MHEDGSAPAPAAAATADGRPLLEAFGLAKRYGEIEAVKPLDLAVRAGDFFAILGPSGCGKTTLLRMIGGFVAPSAGRLVLDGEDVTRLPPERRPTNMVFQGYGLFPHMNVRQNVAYGLTLKRLPRGEIDDRVGALLALMQIDALADRSVDALSGGQQQRVSLARALVMRPRILLLDEPLAALDLKLRYAMQEQLRKVHREIGGTFLFVTHDQGEAMALANRIAVMRDGHIEQEGTSEAIYHRPQTSFVATFIGEANTFAGRREAGRVRLDGGVAFDDPGPDGPVTAVVRPERLRVGRSLAADAVLPARIADVIFLGPHTRYALTLVDGRTVHAHAPAGDEGGSLAPGDAVEVGWTASDQRVLQGAHADGGG